MGDDNNIDRLRATHSYLKVLHEAANNANDKLVKENNLLNDRNKLLSEQFVNVEKTLDIQKKIVRDNIAESQAKHENDYREIEELRTKLKKLEAEIKVLKGR